MYNAFLIHGTGSTSKSNWFPWLKKELERIGIGTVAPDFPIGKGEGKESEGTPEKAQSLPNWLAAFKKYEGKINDRTLLVGHSLGPAFILTLLERVKVRVPAAFLVAPFAESLGIPKFDRPNDTFVSKSFDWARITKNCAEFFVYASDNDPYVPFAKSRLVSDNLNATLRVVHGAGHFNSESMEPVLNDIRAVTSTK